MLTADVYKRQDKPYLGSPWEPTQSGASYDAGKENGVSGNDSQPVYKPAPASYGQEMCIRDRGCVPEQGGPSAYMENAKAVRTAPPGCQEQTDGLGKNGPETTAVRSNDLSLIHI